MSQLDVLVPGAVIAERFRLDRLLGEGGMGAVWAATHVVTQKRVALKVLKGADTDLAVKRFLREARAASAVRHTHIVQVHDVLMAEGGFPLMVMDLCVGESLATRLARQRRLSLAEVAEILVPILSALGTAHAAGIVHRDLKPDNLFLDTAEDGRIVPKVLDFGIAKLNAVHGQAAATAALTETGAFMGTPYYMSPEQVFGEKDIDHRSDVWAMGVIIYECLSGARPFDGSNFGQIMKGITTGTYAPLHQLAPETPLPITELVSRMLRVDRKERPADLREPYELLKHFANTQALSFGGARTVIDVDSGSDTLDPASRSVRELGQAKTQLVTTGASTPARRWLVPAVVGAGAIGVAAALLLRAPPPDRSAPSASPGIASSTLHVEPSQAPLPPTLAPEPSAAPSAPVLSPSAGPLGAGSAKAGKSHIVHEAASGSSAAVAASPDLSKSAAAPSASNRLQGGVVPAVPF